MSDIFDFMKGQVGRVLSVREISKEVDPDRYDRDKTWAARELKGLCSKGMIEAINGCYWIPPEKEKDERDAENESEDGENSENPPVIETRPESHATADCPPDSDGE